MRAGLDSNQRRPFPCWGSTEVGGQPANRRMLHQRGMRELRTTPFLDLNQHACGQQGVAAQSEEVLVQPDGADLKQFFPDLFEPRFDWIEMLRRRWRKVGCRTET